MSNLETTDGDLTLGISIIENLIREVESDIMSHQSAIAELRKERSKLVAHRYGMQKEAGLKWSTK